ncbi:MAG TPA: alpha-mannosidase [Anaerolineae bacterium]|nr:alpha-mannosidase [Anaerolineae bacterium]
MLQFLFEKLDRRIRELQAAVYEPRLALADWRFHNGRLDGGAAVDLDDSAWPEIRLGDRWGEAGRYAWFRRRVRIPTEWAGRPVCLFLSLHAYVPHVVEDALLTSESLVYIDGVPVQGIDRHHREVLLTDCARGGEEFLVAIEAFAGMNPGLRTFAVADLAGIDRDTEALYFDARAAFEAARLLDENSPAQPALLNALNEAFLQLEPRQPRGSAWRASLTRARDHLRARLAAYDDGAQPSIVAAGHAHIDVAWLWPLSVTRGKAARTFATVLKLMEQYPEYRFTQSQPQLYRFVQEDHPSLYARIAERVRQGRWEPTGGMWVEADTNVPSGESLVRQFLFGKRFFRREFGVDNDILWLPDVFGYSAALPQIMAGCGIRYFSTTKMSWNEVNRFPYDTFWWQGIDGTRLLTHYVTGPGGGLWSYTYNGDTDPKSLLGAWKHYAQKGLNDELLISFGHGDGGGGPTKEMLESASRMADFPGIPHCRLGTVHEFFQRLEARGAAWPRWSGELYLEFHRGTYTTQARNKRANRKSEFLYHEAEFLAALAHRLGEPYPHAALNAGWELILLNQFHDILPGSSIAPVYADCAQQYARIRELGQGVRSHALTAIAAAVDVPGPERAVLIYNPLSWARDDVAVVDLGAGGPYRLLDDAGREAPAQPLGDGRWLVDVQGVPAYGYASYSIHEGRCDGATSLRASERELENGFFRLTLNERGEIAGLYDTLRRREVLAPGRVANEWQAFDDRPRTVFDAWDLNHDYEETRYPIEGAASVRVIECGPVRAGVEVRRPLLSSALVQRIYIYERIPRIDFETEIEWREKHVLLKVAFPVHVHAERATFDIQFGNLERPTHRNTSWDAARFEVPAHKWADLSEGDYGVSLLNDCKYGCDVHDDVLRLTVLRSPAYPDAHADEGPQRLTYALYLHGGDWRLGTVQQAYALNAPLGAVVAEPHAGRLPRRWSLVESSRENVVVETVKVAEDTDELVIRLYECYNQRGPVTLRFGAPIASAAACNFIEDGAEPLPFGGDALTLDIAPYQIRTVKVRLAG